MEYWMELVVLRYFQLVVYIAWSSKDLKRSSPKCSAADDCHARQAAT